jgi:hypothetical protein
MNELPKTSLDAKAAILSDLWIAYKKDSQFEDFIEYNDVGLPLAFLYTEGLVEIKNAGSMFIEETFEILLSTLGIEDTGFETLDDVLGSSLE